MVAGSQKARLYQMDVKGLARPAHGEVGDVRSMQCDTSKTPRELGRDKLSRKNGELRPRQGVVLEDCIVVLIG